jgi:Domain of unknown function (DUF2382)
MAKRYQDTDANPELRAGAAVKTDAGMAGTITEVLPDFPDAEGGVRVAWDGGHTTVVPRRALSVERDRILVRTDAGAHTAETRTKEATATGRAGAESEDIVVPVVEERFTTDTQWRDAGGVTLHLRAEEMPETVEEYVTREELEIEEVAVGRLLADGEMPARSRAGMMTTNAPSAAAMEHWEGVLEEIRDEEGQPEAGRSAADDGMRAQLIP